ncbi:hypothetical protein [Raineyella fluvialis]|uniref:Uncharacterized protein n=1 Tax=Raineyella fluvialis TaxID=2662261 RepID=A0A5Q2FC85_9ACTN|nr:hypothetical protein [Raineyella fluvialis]QGF24670.1 hypothetical protein Rai3103_14660 [Raineyella fluvialis]
MATPPHIRSAAGAIDEVLTRVRAARESAAETMARLGGGTSACALARDGQSFPAYKYHEGRAAAYGTIIRRLRLVNAPGARVVLEALCGEWRDEVERRDGQDPDWRAYAAGGLDAAETALGWLSSAE